MESQASFYAKFLFLFGVLVGNFEVEKVWLQFHLGKNLNVKNSYVENLFR